MLSPNIREAMATPSSLFSAYASFTASMMLARTMLNDVVPRPIQTYVWHAICSLFVPKSPDKQELTLVAEEYAGDLGKNQIYSAAELYLSSMIGTDTDRLKICKSPSKAHVLVRLARDETLRDTFEGIDIMWKFVSVTTERQLKKAHSNDRDHVIRDTKRYFELSFEKKYKDKIIESYVPYVIDKSTDLMGKERVLKMFTLGVYGPGRSMSANGKWSSINLDHPSTFDTLAMDPGLKKTVMDDLNRFLGRREFYKRVGRAWKRGYLLYGPPGTGKSSLVAAMANYIKFDVYDLQLSNIRSDSQLRELLLDTGNSSILVIEDIDCSIDLPDRSTPSGGKPLPGYIPPRYELTLSGLLNFIDGLWSSCGDERIIVFTTNHIEKLDPALLRPGRMDMKIHMSYCTYRGFKLLASNYLGVKNDDQYLNVLSEVESLISESNVTPAEVADEFMKSEDPGVALDGLVKLLKRKKMDATIGNSELVVDDSFEDHSSKKQKVEE